MARKKIENMTEQERNAYFREKKIAEDSKKLREYKKRMQNTMKNYGQTFNAFAINQRKSREAALGACALKALDAVRELMRSKSLEPGSLWFMISESPLKDDNGKKKFHCQVLYSVTSHEPAFTDEEIQKELEDTFEKMMRETDALYPEEGEHEEKENNKETAKSKDVAGHGGE